MSSPSPSVTNNNNNNNTPTQQQQQTLFSPQEALPIPHNDGVTAAAACPILNPPPVAQDQAYARKCPVIHKDESASPTPSTTTTNTATAKDPSAPLSAKQRLRKALCSAGFASIITTMITGAFWQPIMTILVRQQFLAQRKATIPTAPTTTAAAAASTTTATNDAALMAAKAASHNSLLNVGRGIASEGKRIFFRGLTPRLMQSPLACVQWTAYEIFRETLANRNESDLARIKYALVFVLSRALVTFTKCPFEVVKERMQVQGLVPEFNKLSQHSSSWQHFKYIVQQEGVPALFRALPINICRDIPIAVLMMVGNDFFTHLYMTGSPIGFWDKYFVKDKQNRQNGGKTPSHISFCAGASAGLVATLVTQPIDVAKTIIQTQGLQRAAAAVTTTTTGVVPTTSITPDGYQYKGLFDVLKRVRAERGIAGWFSGTPLRASHLMLGGAIYLPLYRTVQQQLKFGFDVPQQPKPVKL